MQRWNQHAPVPQFRRFNGSNCLSVVKSILRTEIDKTPQLNIDAQQQGHRLPPGHIEASTALPQMLLHRQVSWVHGERNLRDCRWGTATVSSMVLQHVLAASTKLLGLVKSTSIPCLFSDCHDYLPVCGEEQSRRGKGNTELAREPNGM